MTLPGLAGDTNRLSDVSPTPKIESVSPTGTLLSGMIDRLMIFHFSPVNGMTGWMFMLKSVRSYGPVLTFQLVWNGSEIRLASGFWTVCARSASLGPC